MGLDCNVYSMSLVDKQVYIVDIVKQATYPRTFAQLRKDGISNLAGAQETVDVSFEGYERLYALITLFLISLYVGDDDDFGKRLG
jgi:hypothetical protein